MKPVLQALLLADRVYQDQRTGKHIIAGTFNSVLFKKTVKQETIIVDGEERQKIPGGTQAGTPSAYISLTDIRGKVDCELRYVTLDEDKVIYRFQFGIECEDPLQTVELILPLPPLPHIAGVHALELLCNDEPIGAHRIRVQEIPENNDDNPNY